MIQKFMLKNMKKLSLTQVVVFSTVLTGFYSTSLAMDQSFHPVQSNDANAVDVSSLTSCIDNSQIANEIEISGAAMKKAALKLLGHKVDGAAQDREETVEYCALNLV